jgi:hypothetical protein
MIRCGKLLVVLVLGLLTLALPLAGEEFYLKDGNKIVGTIVAYEKDSFRVETSFGFAVIYKDRVERIVFTETPGAKDTSKASPTGTPPTPTRKDEGSPAAAQPTSAPAPPATPPSDGIIEHTTGTAYVNETYRFRLFKPPTWRSYPELVKPQTPLVAALGTPDETTLLLIGREYHAGGLGDYARLAEQSLKQLYEDYRVEEEKPIQVGGQAAIERRFTGTAEGRFWTGLAVYFSRQGQYYTLLGLTAAGEQTSFQLAVLRKVVHTLSFLP